MQGMKLPTITNKGFLLLCHLHPPWDAFTTLVGPLSVAMLCLCQIYHKLESFGRRDSQLRKCLPKTGLQVSLPGIFLINDWI